MLHTCGYKIPLDKSKIASLTGRIISGKPAQMRPSFSAEEHMSWIVSGFVRASA
jgi:hypothetical protein